MLVKLALKTIEILFIVVGLLFVMYALGAAQEHTTTHCTGTTCYTYGEEDGEKVSGTSIRDGDTEYYFGTKGDKRVSRITTCNETFCRTDEEEEE